MRASGLARWGGGKEKGEATTGPARGRIGSGGAPRMASWDASFHRRHRQPYVERTATSAGGAWGARSGACGGGGGWRRERRHLGGRDGPQPDTSAAPNGLPSASCQGRREQFGSVGGGGGVGATRHLRGRGGRGLSPGGASRAAGRHHPPPDAGAGRTVGVPARRRTAGVGRWEPVAMGGWARATRRHTSAADSRVTGWGGAGGASGRTCGGNGSHEDAARPDASPRVDGGPVVTASASSASPCFPPPPPAHECFPTDGTASRERAEKPHGVTVGAACGVTCSPRAAFASWRILGGTGGERTPPRD